MMLHAQNKHLNEPFTSWSIFSKTEEKVFSKKKIKEIGNF